MQKPSNRPILSTHPPLKPQHPPPSQSFKSLQSAIQIYYSHSHLYPNTNYDRYSFIANPFILIFTYILILDKLKVRLLVFEEIRENMDCLCDAVRVERLILEDGLEIDAGMQGRRILCDFWVWVFED